MNNEEQGKAEVSGLGTKISVIIPLYNKADSIIRALDSVGGQSYPPHEIIVVDDGSTDSGLQLALKWRQEGLTAKVVSQKNRGAGSARNEGIRMSSGEFLAFLDADDEWDSTFLAKIVEIHHLYPECIMLSTAYTNISETGIATIRNARALGSLEFLNANEYFEIILREGWSINNSSTSVLRRSFLEEYSIGFDEEARFFEDHVVWYCAALAFGIGYCAEPRVQIHKGGKNRSQSQFSIEKFRHSVSRLHLNLQNFARINNIEIPNQLSLIVRGRMHTALKHAMIASNFQEIKNCVEEFRLRGMYRILNNRWFAAAATAVYISIRRLKFLSHRGASAMNKPCKSGREMR